MKMRYYILYKDKLVRKNRLFDCVPYAFDNYEDAEKFILDMRCTLIDGGESARRSDFIMFNTEFDLDTVQFDRIGKKKGDCNGK